MKYTEEDFNNHPLIKMAGLLWLMTCNAFSFMCHHAAAMFVFTISTILFVLTYAALIGVPFGLAYLVARNL